MATLQQSTNFRFSLSLMLTLNKVKVSFGALELIMSRPLNLVEFSTGHHHWKFASCHLTSVCEIATIKKNKKNEHHHPWTFSHIDSKNEPGESSMTEKARASFSPRSWWCDCLGGDKSWCNAGTVSWGHLHPGWGLLPDWLPDHEGHQTPPVHVWNHHCHHFSDRARPVSNRCDIQGVAKEVHENRSENYCNQSHTLLPILPELC